jgi:hypothetical protein
MMQVVKTTELLWPYADRIDELAEAIRKSDRCGARRKRLNFKAALSLLKLERAGRKLGNPNQSFVTVTYL